MADLLRVRNGIFDSNTYFCVLSDPGECVIVDAGLDSSVINQALDHSGLRPQAVFCTHGHFDHVGSSGDLQRRFDIPVYLHRDDARTASGANFLMMALKVPGRIVLPRFELVDDNFAVQVGGYKIRYLHAPGHTPGSSVVLFRGSAFTGDTVYRRGIDRVCLPGQDEALLRRSILGLWDSLPDDTLVRPGHGGSAPFAEIKRQNVGLRRFLGLES